MNGRETAPVSRIGLLADVNGASGETELFIHINCHRDQL